MSQKLQRLGAYQIQRTIGRGRAEVYLAYHPSYGQVALKVIPPCYGGRHHIEERFEREVQMLKRMRHPNVLRLYDSGTLPAPHGGRYYFLATEYMPDGSLCDLLHRNQGRLPELRALIIAIQIADALAYVHSNGIIHRDIKPNNVLMRGDQAILCDFGISRAIAHHTITQDKQLLGTLAYMSPEQTMGDRNVVRRGSDIYTFGVVLYEMLSGYQPRNNPNLHDLAVLSMIQNHPLPPLRQVAPHISKEIAAVIDRCVQPQRTHRYKTMDHVAEALRHAAAQHGYRLPSPPRVTDVQAIPLKTNGAIIAGIVSIVLVSLVVIVLLSGAFG